MEVRNETRCWILSTVRSGSSYLASLLGGVGEFKELYNWGNKYDRVILPQNCKILRRQFLRFFNDNDYDYIDKKMPNIKYIWMHRENIYSRAISFYFVLMTNKWYLYDHSKYDEWHKNKIPFIPEIALMSYYECVNSHNNNWDLYVDGKNCLKIEYEELCFNRKETLRSISEYLDVDIGEANKVPIKQKRTETEEYIEKLRELIELDHNAPECLTNNEKNVYVELIEKAHRRTIKLI